MPHEKRKAAVKQKSSSVIAGMRYFLTMSSGPLVRWNIPGHSLQKGISHPPDRGPGPLSGGGMVLLFSFQRIVEGRPVLPEAFMGKKQGLAGTAEKPVLVFPPLARYLSVAIGADRCEFHTPAPFPLVSP